MGSSSLIVIGYCSILLLFLLTGLLKATNHMKYLKIVFPEKYGHYKSYFSVFIPNSSYSTGLQFLIFPYFKRILDKEDAASKLLVKKIKLYQYLNLFFLTILLLPILIGVLS